MQDMKWYGSQFNSWSGNQNDAKAGPWRPLPNQLIDRGEDDLKDDEFFDDEEEDDKNDDTNHEYDDEDDLFDGRFTEMADQWMELMRSVRTSGRTAVVDDTQSTLKGLFGQPVA